MNPSVKYFALIGFLLVGATGKYLHGPWLISKVPQFISNRVGGNNLSPVIFGEVYFCTVLFISFEDSKVQHLIVSLFFKQFPAMAEVKSTQS